MAHTRQTPQQSTDPVAPAPMWSAGWRPDRANNGQPAGPYAHLSTMDSGSIQAGFGLMKNQWSNGAALDVLNANAEIGMMGAPGSRRLGGKADANMFNGKTPDNYWLGGEMGVFNANAEASVGQDGATVGAGAQVIGGAVRFGENTKDRANDSQVRLGASFGVGAAGRLHWSDSDNDGHREYGFGGDVGPISFDLKSEDPLMSLAMLPVGGLGLQTLLDETGIMPKDFNLTDTVVGGVSNAASAVGSGISSAASWAGNGISNAAGAVGNGISSAWNWLTGD